MKKEFGARLILDDAHGTGVFGPQGRGTAYHFGLEREIDLHLGTFSKALGTLGGFAAGDRRVIDFLRFSAPTLLFTKSLPLAIVAATSKALELLQAADDQRAKLWNNAAPCRTDSPPTVSTSARPSRRSRPSSLPGPRRCGLHATCGGAITSGRPRCFPRRRTGQVHYPLDADGSAPGRTHRPRRQLAGHDRLRRILLVCRLRSPASSRGRASGLGRAQRTCLARGIPMAYVDPIRRDLWETMPWQTGNWESRFTGRAGWPMPMPPAG